MRKTIWLWRAVAICPLYATQATWTFAQSTFDGLLRTLDSIIDAEIPSLGLGPLYELCSSLDGYSGLSMAICIAILTQSFNVGRFHRQLMRFGKIDDTYPLVRQIVTIDEKLHLVLDNSYRKIPMENLDKWLVSKSLLPEDSYYIQQADSVYQLENRIRRRLERKRVMNGGFPYMDNFLLIRHKILEQDNIFLKSPEGTVYRMRFFTPQVRRSTFTELNSGHKAFCKKVALALQQEQTSQKQEKENVGFKTGDKSTLGIYAMHCNGFFGERRLLQAARVDWLNQFLFHRKPKVTKE